MSVTLRFRDGFAQRDFAESRRTMRSISMPQVDDPLANGTLWKGMTNSAVQPLSSTVARAFQTVSHSRRKFSLFSINASERVLTGFTWKKMPLRLSANVSRIRLMRSSETIERSCVICFAISRSGRSSPATHTHVERVAIEEQEYLGVLRGDGALDGFDLREAVDVTAARPQVGLEHTVDHRRLLGLDGRHRAEDQVLCGRLWGAHSGAHAEPEEGPYQEPLGGGAHRAAPP